MAGSKINHRIIFAVSQSGSSIDVFTEVFSGNKEYWKLWVEWREAGVDLQRKMSAGINSKNLRSEKVRMNNAARKIHKAFPGAARWLPVDVSWRMSPGGNVKIAIDLPPGVAERAESLIDQIEAFLMGEAEKKDGRGIKKKSEADLRALREYRKIMEAASQGQKHYIEGLKNERHDSRSADVVRGRVKKRATRILQKHKISE